MRREGRQTSRTCGSVTACRDEGSLDRDGSGDLRAIHDYIALDSAEYARRTVDRLTRRSRQIAAFPLGGRVVPEYQSDRVREVFEGWYRIIYRIKPD